MDFIWIGDPTALTSSSKKYKEKENFMNAI